MRENHHIFRQINVFTKEAKEVSKELISRKILERDRVLSYFSTLSLTKIFSSNQLDTLGIYLVNPLLSRNFC